MKKISKLLLTAAVAAGLWSCEGEDNLMFLEPQAAEFAILTPDSGQTIILTEATPQDNPALTFTWEDVDYGTPTEVNYTVEFAANGTDFATPVAMTSSTAQNYAITVGQLNNAAHALYPDLEDEASAAIDVRIVASVGTTGSMPKYSNTITIVVTPFTSAVVELPQLYFVGSATAAGWNNNNNNTPLFRDPANPNKFYYTGYFLNDGTAGAGEFKLLEKRGFWQPQWGQNGGELAVNDGTGSDPGAFTIATSGYYTFEVDIDEMTYTLAPYLTPVPSAISTIGAIGSAVGGWDNDIDMTPSAFDPHIWKLGGSPEDTGYVMTTGELKFRADNDWALAWGSTTALSGVASSAPGSPNIPVTAGAYDIYFNDIDGRYLLIPRD